LWNQRLRTHATVCGDGDSDMIIDGDDDGDADDDGVMAMG
jgi:hypothetical protein